MQLLLDVVSYEYSTGSWCVHKSAPGDVCLSVIELVTGYRSSLMRDEPLF